MEPKNKPAKGISGAWLAALGVGFLFAVYFADRRLAVKLAAVRFEAKRTQEAVDASVATLEELRSLRDLRMRDANDYKEALKNQTRSKNAVYGAGAALQEEKRLLEKQLEIMTTYVDVKEETGRISLMRGDHALKDYPFSYSPLKSFGPSAQNMPASARIISKERFANPERGKVQEVDGKIMWDPPQAGKDPRSGGLGEYVLFTDSPLIMHGPPPSKELHNAFPHICAGVTAYTAKRLFENTFVGTKILYEKGRGRKAP
jgi:hypothetical protein